MHVNYKVAATQNKAERTVLWLKLKSADIFKGIFEVQKSAKSAKVFAKTRPNKT